MHINYDRELEAEIAARIEASTPVASTPQPGNVLRKALLTVESRGKDYGTPYARYASLARLWSTLLGVHVTAEQVVRCLIALKLDRLSETPDHEDSILDIAGYAWVLDEVRKAAPTQNE